MEVRIKSRKPSVESLRSKSFILMCSNIYVKNRCSFDQLGSFVQMDGRSIRGYIERYLPDMDIELYRRVKKTAERNMICNREYLKYTNNPPTWREASDLYLEYLFTVYSVEKVANLFHVTYDAARMKKTRLKEKLKKQDLCL